MKVLCSVLGFWCLLSSQVTLADIKEPIKPIPQTIKLDTQLFQLGSLIFYDKRLSKNKNVACDSCHKASEGLAENISFSTSSNGKLRNRNTQSLFNSTYLAYLHWDGKFSSLEELSRRGMKGATSNSWENILEFLKNDEQYAKIFLSIFSDGVTKNNVSKALAEYQKSYITPNSAFDQYLRGDKTAMSMKQKHGYTLFKNYGCVSCHNSMTIGGQMFAKLGQFGNYFKDRGDIKDADYGRYRVTNRESDRFKFRVPSLRNVALTAPYFHDATQKTLKDAIQTMAKYQLGRSLSEDDTFAIESFLKTLTGTFNGKPL